ncbi:MAG TPA: serine/threonine-protein kinase [Minicystis sp.]|nr:serine/threonine-protein kinase [Minicystis sp.]
MAGTVRPPAGSSVAISVRGEDPRIAHAMTNIAPSSASLSSPNVAKSVMAKVCPTCGVHYPAEFKVCPRDATELEEKETDAQRDSLVGSTLGSSYTIVRVIGEGGMGRVYEARHTRIGSKRFAIKMLHPEFARQPDVISRFQREAEAAAAIRSPFVVDVYDVDRSQDGRPYLVGEFLEGKEFADYLAEVKKMPVGPAVRIVRQICKALAAAHDQGVVHRDMKPENVFLTGDMARPTAKVIDFGISKIGDTPGTALTKTGMIMGTPSYMAPEQARGEKVDHRADVYAVGAILYCALTGQRPFDRGDPTATLTAVLTQDPPRPRSIEPSIPEPLEVIVQRAMAKRPSDRHQSMQELDAELAPYDVGEELVLPSAPGSSPFLSGAATTTGKHRASGLLDKQAREVSMARPMILLLTSVGVFWVMAGLIGTITAVVRMLRGGVAANLTGSEAWLLVLGIMFTLLTPILLGVRYVSREVWGNSMKSVDLAERLRAPVIVGLCAYGFASLVVRMIESVILRRAVGVAWPVWDLLLFAIGAFAGLAALAYVESERRRRD